MQQLQNFIAGNPESFHEFIVSLLIMAAMTGLFIIYMNRRAVGDILFHIFGFIAFLIWNLIIGAVSVYNYIASVWNGFIDWMAKAEEAKQSLTIEERIYLDETNLWI